MEKAVSESAQELGKCHGWDCSVRIYLDKESLYADISRQFSLLTDADEWDGDADNAIKNTYTWRIQEKREQWTRRSKKAWRRKIRKKHDKKAKEQKSICCVGFGCKCKNLMMIITTSLV